MDINLNTIKVKNEVTYRMWKKYLSGYKHIDVVDHDHIDFVSDARELNIIANESVS